MLCVEMRGYEAAEVRRDWEGMYRYAFGGIRRLSRMCLRTCHASLENFASGKMGEVEALDQRVWKYGG
jgi:hypothetical protein